MKQQHHIITGLFLALALMLASMSTAYSNFVAYDTPTMLGRIGTIGYIYENGHPVLAEYDSEGKWVSDIGWDDRYNSMDILSGNEYRAALKLFKDYIATHPEYTDHSLTGPAKGARFVSRKQFETLLTSFKPILEPEQALIPPRLKAETKSLFIVAENKILTAQSPLVLLEFPILMDANTTLESEIVSLIIDTSEANKGQVLRTSSYQISYKVEEYSNREEDVSKRDLVLAAPLSGVPVTASLDWSEIQDVSDEKGEWKAQMDPMLFCPWGMLGFSVQWPVIAQVPYRNFNPKINYPDTMYRPVMGSSIKNCNYIGIPILGFDLVAQSIAIDITGIIASGAIPVMQPIDIFISTMKLDGIGFLLNPEDYHYTATPVVALGDATVYTSDEFALPNSDPNSANFDFDGDGVADNVRPNGNQVDVYLDRDPNDTDADGNPIDPYFTRLADRAYAPQTLHQGLLQSISQADLEDTDIYFFRQSTGLLVGHLEGLIEGGTSADASQSEQAGIVKTSYTGSISYRGVHTDSEVAKFGFSSLLLGARTIESKYFAKGSSIDGGETDRDNYEQAQRKPWLERGNDSAGSATDFADRSADFLIPGEKIKIVAINRKTGYIGTKVTQLGSPDAKQYSMEVADEFGALERTIILRPPNLKINVTRDYKVESGITKDTEQRFTIGSEGAGLASDKAIAIQTIWLDHDGTPLPDSLPGYTARIAISTGDATKGVSENYEVEPGIHTGVVQLPGNLATSAKHFYVQLVGENIDGNPSFEGTGAGTGKLATRPRYYVPVIVPIFNEAETRHQENLLRDAKADGVTGLPDKVNPIYDWVYRPEMQFSVFDFKMNAIQQQDDELNVIDIYPAGADDDQSTIPVLSPSYDIARLLFDLNTSGDALPLDRFSGPQEVVLAVGEQELQGTINGDGVLVFDNLDHLGSLAIEDYMSIRLFLNNDSQNTLWEFAFEILNLFPPSSAGEVEVSADDNEVILYANIPGYLGRPEESRTPYRINWTTEGGGSISPPTETNQDGGYSASLLLPRTANDEVEVTAKLGGGDGLPTRSVKYKVVPGEPGVITVNQSGQAAIAGVGQINLQIEVKDNWNNPVADGTAISINSDGDLSIDSTYETSGGYVNATINGLETAGVKNLTIASGDATASQSVSIADLTLNIAMSTSAQPKDVVPVEITASSSVIGVVNNVSVLLRTNKGNLEDNIVPMNNGVARTQLYVGEKTGTGSFSAQINSVLVSTNFTVEEPAGAGGRPKLAVPLLMADSISDGILYIVDGAGAPVADLPYVTSTELSVNGTPGETSTIHLGSLINPVKEAVLDYPMFYYNVNNTVPDRYGIINGAASDITMVKDSVLGFRGSYKFDNSSVRIPNHIALDKPDQIGFSLYFKPHQSSGTLVDYTLRSQKLELTADNRLSYQIVTDIGTYSVSSAPIDLNQWHSVGAHYNNGELQLEVDGLLTTAPGTGSLRRQTSSTAMTLGYNYQGQMNRFKVIDWSFPDLVVFAGTGSTSQQATYDVNGVYITQIQSTGLMGNRTVATREESGFDIALGFFIPTAHAATAGQSIPMQVDVVNDSSPGYFENMYLSTKEAVQDGFDVAGELAGLAWDVSVDAASSALAAADFVISFVPFIGDGKDLAIQGIYAMFDSPDYDELTVIVAILGLAADTTALVGGAGIVVSGGTSAVVVGAAVVLSALAKTIKLYSKVMPRALNKVLINFFRKLLVKVRDQGWSYASNALSFSALLYAILGDPELREMLYGMIQTDDDLLAWVDYIGEYSDQPEGIADNHQFNLLDFFVKPAHAVRADKFADILREVKDSLKASGLYDGATGVRKMGKELTHAIKELEKLGTARIPSGVRFSVKGLSVFLKIHRIGGVNSLKKLVYFASEGGNKLVLNVDELFADIDALDIKKFKELVPNEGGLKYVIEQLGSPIRWFRQGASYHIHVIKVLADEVKNIELLENVTNAFGKTIAKTRADIRKINGDVVEVKAIDPTPENLTKYFKADIRFKKSAADPKTVLPGQFYKRILEFAKNDFTGVVFAFDRRAKGQESMIAKVFVDTLKKADSNIVSKMIGDLNLSVRYPNAESQSELWRLFTNEFKANVTKIVSVIE